MTVFQTIRTFVTLMSVSLFVNVALSGSVIASSIDIEKIEHGEKPAILLVEAENGRWTKIDHEFPIKYNLRIKAQVKGPLIGAKGIKKVVVRERGMAMLLFGSDGNIHQQGPSINWLPSILRRSNYLRR